MNKTKRFFSWSLLTLILAVALALSWRGVAEAKKFKIVTTTTDLASIAEAVAGEHAEVTSLCTGKEDPHFLQARPSYIVMARDADLWIRVGVDLEIGWEPPILEDARNSAIHVGSRGHLDASEKVIRLDVPTTRVTRAMGDVHPEGNPHYWLDPLNGRIVAASIADRLEALAPLYRLSENEGKTILLAHHGLGLVEELTSRICLVHQGNVVIAENERAKPYGEGYFPS